MYSRAIAVDRHRARKRFSPHALEIPQVGEVVMPLRVTASLLGQPRSVCVRVEELICQENERGDPLLVGVGRRPAAHSSRDRRARGATFDPGGQKPHGDHAARAANAERGASAASEA